MIVICRGADVRYPCKYATTCRPALQSVMHELDLRGFKCVHFEMLEMENAYPGQQLSSEQQREFGFAKVMRP